jgi:hypothetical protein
MRPADTGRHALKARAMRLAVACQLGVEALVFRCIERGRQLVEPAGPVEIHDEIISDTAAVLQALSGIHAIAVIRMAGGEFYFRVHGGQNSASIFKRHSELRWIGWGQFDRFLRSALHLRYLITASGIVDALGIDELAIKGMVLWINSADGKAFEASGHGLQASSRYLAKASRLLDLISQSFA